MEQTFGFIAALTFGGMIAFQLLFAPLLFTQLDMPIARKFIRAFFPYYYLYFGILTLLAFVISVFIQGAFYSILIGICLLGFIVSRQVLMPKANQATDSGKKSLFHLYHRTTVIINTLQLLVFGFLLYGAFL